MNNKHDAVYRKWYFARLNELHKDLVSLRTLCKNKFRRNDDKGAFYYGAAVAKNIIHLRKMRSNSLGAIITTRLP